MNKELWEKCVEFHGHECPGLAIGFRAAVEASKYIGNGKSEDESIVCVTENDHKVVKRAIETMELQAFEMRNISELSGGELQKVMLARASAQEPKLLLLDEPTSSLDPRNQYSVMRQICRISKSENIAVIVIIHDLNLAMRYCDRFLFLKDGKIFAYGGQEIMTKACLESVYEMAFDIIDYNGTKVSIPCPSNINWK